MTGYHANDKRRCEKFVNDKSFLIVDNDDTCYLGTGMYFWEHQSRAEWWLKEQNKESIVSAELDLTKMLDLTDDEKLSYIEKAADLFYSGMKRKGIKPDQVGLKLDYLFESYKELSDTYEAIKAHFWYGRKEESNFLFGSRLTGKCVDIYTIRRNPDLVRNRKWV